MSRIGKMPVNILAGVKIDIKDGTIKVEGPKGKLSREIPRGVEVKVDSGKIIARDSPDQLIDKLIASGFERPREMKLANLEDVFINLTGHSLRED